MADEFTEPAGGAPAAEEVDIAAASESLVEDLGELDGGESAAPAGETAEPASADPLPAKPAAESPAGSPPVVDPADRPPVTWKPEVAAAWAQVPAPVKEEIRRREYDFAREHERLSQSAKVGNTVQEMFAPIAAHVERLGVNPWQKTGELWNMYINFQNSDHETKLRSIVQFAAEAGLDLSRVGGPAVPDVVMQMQARMRELEEGVGQAHTRILQENEAKLTAEIESFAADAAAHPHFWDVVPEMVELYKAGKVKTLAQAYELAVRLNPLTWTKEVDRLADAKRQATAAEAQRRAEAARKAARANVRSTSGRGASPPSKSVDQTLSDTFDAIVAREG
jgi:hypothetical protein